MLLTDAELAELTERVQPAAQRRQLDRMGILYHKRPSGRPAVTWDALLSRLNTYLREHGTFHDQKSKRDGRVYVWTPHKPAGQDPLP